MRLLVASMALALFLAPAAWAKPKKKKPRPPPPEKEEKAPLGSAYEAEFKKILKDAQAAALAPSADLVDCAPFEERHDVLEDATAKRLKKKKDDPKLLVEFARDRKRLQRVCGIGAGGE